MASDDLPDTPSVARVFCPGCEPDADPAGEILEVRWCSSHRRGDAGIEDARVGADALLTGAGEAGGAENRAWCELLHRHSADSAPASAPEVELDARGARGLDEGNAPRRSRKASRVDPAAAGELLAHHVEPTGAEVPQRIRR